ncbi:MAG: beta-propeller fold lactonase family protein [Elusimicrobia bacterium]|nr:beta-propeller fold lactonase family protein [Elusimicrobiota bacterium]
MLRKLLIFLLCADTRLAAKGASFPATDEITKTAKQGIPIGTSARAGKGAYSIALTGRIQHYNPKPSNPNDHYDVDIQSPKSVKFAPDGKKTYVNSLEGGVTAVFDAASLKKLSVIRHRFNETNQNIISNQEPFDYYFLVKPKNGNVNQFIGKPVEMTLSHQGRYLWISYYRRHYDEEALDPSAVAVVDTTTDEIVKVLPSGPIPKYIAVSPDNRQAAFIHWGDNTIGLVDIAGEPNDFQLDRLVTVEKRLSLSSLKPKPGKTKIDRDEQCGYCLRGAVFSADGKYLLVGRLSGGGIAVIDAEERRYLGTAWGMKPTPRHLVLSADSRWLYVGSNVGGYVAKFPVQDVIKQAQEKNGKATPQREAFIGRGVRTIALSPDEKWLYAAVNAESKLVVMDADTLEKTAEIAVDSFPVGLDVSPDGSQVWVTSQGRSLRGGNSVSIYSVKY